MTEDEDSPDGLPKPAAWGIGGEIVNAVANEVTKYLVMAHGVDPETAAAVAGGVGGALKGSVDSLQRAYERRRARGLEAIEAAEDRSGLDRFALLHLALADDRRLELLTSAIETAMRDADRRKVRCYGRLAADGVVAKEDSQVVQSTRVFSALAALDAVDLRVLLHMALPSERPWVVVRDQDEDTSRDALTRSLAEELPDLGDVLDPVYSRLTGLGLLVNRLGQEHWADAFALSPFARLCVCELMRGDGAGT